jgi:hypothetical protein
MAEKPIRVQRKRTKGYKMPPDTVSVTRPGWWGNPFVIGGHYKLGTPGTAMTYIRAYEWEPGYTTLKTKEECIEWYEKYLELSPTMTKRIKEELRDKNVACFCPLDQPCYGDIILRIANS